MVKTSNINIRVEPELKKQAEDTLKDLGLNIADAINIYLRQIVMTESIPFEIKKPKYSKELLEAIKEAEEIEKYPENYKAFDSVEEFMEDLNKYEE